MTPVYYFYFLRLCIMIFLLTVSPGYDKNSEKMTDACAQKNLTMMDDPCGNMISLPVSQIPKQSPLQINILGTATDTPLYKPQIPSDLHVFLRQSFKPVNSLSLIDFPRSTPILVLAKSKGCTNRVVILPARPPFIVLMSRQYILSSLVSDFMWKKPLKKSLKEKLRAWVGKYRTTLTQLPRHNEITPSYLTHRVMQSVTPVYFFNSLWFSTWVCIKSLTLSTGATTVLEMIPATPPEIKS